MKKFSDFSDGDSVTVLTHTGRWQAARVRCFGEQQLYRVRVGRGANSQVVRATREHAWLLSNGQETRSLQPGDKLCKPPHLVRDWSFEDSSELSQRYWARGFAYGDGSVSRNAGKEYGTRLRLCGIKARFVDRFERLGYEARYPKWSEGDPCVALGDYNKTLPSLESDGFENVMAFVRGYLDADGSRNMRHPETADINPFQGIQVTGEESIAFVRQVFPVVGAYIVAEDERTNQPTNYGERSGETVYFSLVLGFSNSPVAPYIVREIVPDTVEKVWCLVVEEDHSFVLPNGVVTRNCDPTLTLITDAEMADIRKGSDNAIKLPTGSSSNYLEISGSGPKAALDLAGQLRSFALESAQCVLEHPEMSQRTATEIERAYSSMLAKADVLREQYGQKSVLPLAEMMIAAARKLTSTTVKDPTTGEVVRVAVILPKKKVINDETGEPEYKAPILGPGGLISLQWPHYFEPLLSDVELATRSAIAARAGQILDLEHAVAFVAEYYNVEDVQGLVTRLKAEVSQQQDQMMNQALGMLRSPGVPGSENTPDEEAFDTTGGAEE